MKKIFLFTLTLLNINLCNASEYYCNGGRVIDTSVSAESFCKPYISVQAPNQEAYEHNKHMYQNCLNYYNNAKNDINKGLCKSATKRTYKGSCGETITEYSVSGNKVESFSTGGDVACMKRKYDAETKKMLEMYGVK